MVLDAAAKASGGGDGSIDFKLIHGLMEDAIYGGRVDKASDLRVLRAYVTSLYSAATLRGGPLTRTLSMPADCGHDALTRWAAALPDEDSPALFGLPENIQRAVQRSGASAVHAQLRALSASAAASTKFDRERWRNALGPLIDLWAKLIAGEPLGRAAGGAGARGRTTHARAKPRLPPPSHVCVQVLLDSNLFDIEFSVFYFRGGRKGA